MISSDITKEVMGAGGRRRGIAPALWFCLLMLQNAHADHEVGGAHDHFHDFFAGGTTPEAGASAQWERARALQARVDADPGSATNAAVLARAYLELFRYEGEPKLLGLAGDALAGWIEDPDPPAPVALERAVLWQTEHRFAAAYAELQRVVRREPRNTRAWLMLAAVAKEIGLHPAARRACGQLLLSDPVLGGACTASVWTDTGNAREAYSMLDGILRNHHVALGVDVTVWIHSLAAEAAVAFNRPDFAETHLINALDSAAHANRPPEIYLLVEYADFLVEQGREDEVAALLRGAPDAPSIAFREQGVRETAEF